jgi:hypothetical protein
MRLCPACCSRHFVEPVLSVPISFGKPGIARLSISDLVPPSQMCAHPLFQVPSHSAESPAAVAKVEITHPATHRRVDLADQPVHRHDCPCPGRQPGDALLDRLQGFLRWTDVGIVLPSPAALAPPDFKPKKVELPLVGI